MHDVTVVTVAAVWLALGIAVVAAWNVVKRHYARAPVLAAVTSATHLDDESFDVFVWEESESACQPHEAEHIAPSDAFIPGSESARRPQLQQPHS